MAGNRKTLFDSLRKAFGAKDEAEREQHLSAAEEAMPGDDDSHEGDGHHITLNITAPPVGSAETKPKDAETGEGGEPAEGDMDEDKVKGICAAAIQEAMGPITSALEAITAKIDGMSTKVDAASEKADTLAEAMGDIVDPDDMTTQDAIARAEILAPGLQMPARDAKPGSKAHRDALCNFQREALKRALTTDAGRAAVLAVAGHAQPHRIGTLPAGEVNAIFRGASTLMAGLNTSNASAALASATAGYVRDDAGNRVRPMNTADLARNHAEYYAKRRA